MTSSKSGSTAPVRSPKVSFVVPCYKLAHLLPECVESILAQTHRNLEVLIMDDCSPDDTSAVARSFNDARVRHVRNDPNLGHLRNYNKGISLASGDYIWLISADDRLRRPYVVQRYVAAMEANPRLGYAFCTGMSLQDGRETGIVGWADLQRPDGILGGRQFLRRLLESNCVLAPAGLVRRECYERIGTFPTDLPFAGDWYLWCIFALYYDVAYFAEPMVNYREHSASMTDAMIGKDIRLLARDDQEVRWRILERLEQEGEADLAEHCRETLVNYFRTVMTSASWRGGRYRMSLGEFEQFLATHARDSGEAQDIRKRVFAGIGKKLYWDDQFTPDLEIYRLALEYGPPNRKLRLKYMLLRLGGPGAALLFTLSALRVALRRLHGSLAA